MSTRRTALILGATLTLGAASIGSAVLWQGRDHPRFSTVPVARGDLQSTVSATGTLNAVVTVPVGTQVSGTIQQLFADYNSPVTKGQLIARLDPAAFEAKVNQAKADVESAQATVLAQRAAVAKAAADLGTPEANIVRAQVAVRDTRTKREARDRLFGEGNLSQEERDTAQAANDAAGADLEAGQASMRAAQAGVEAARAQLVGAEATLRQKQAVLAEAQVALENTAIRAPVDGVVVARNVDVGQTVAVSLQAPTLFLIAQDLAKMQVDANVDEADVGKTALGQDATFTVDAYPGRRFQGPVVQIRQAPQVIQNVVTYDVVVAVPNPDLKLLPGMTANVQILVQRRDQVLLIPTAAFRVRLDGVAAAGAGQRGGTQPGGSGRPDVGPAARSAGSAAGVSADSGRQQVWVLQGEQPVRHWVQAGLSDGERTEVVAGLQAGDSVIVGPAAPARAGAGTSSGPRLGSR